MKTTKIIYTLTVLTAITLGLNAKADEANNYAKQKQYEKSDLESILGTGIKNSKLTSKNPVHWEASKCEENIVDKSIKYGEKFNCEVVAKDNKKYLLSIEWGAKPAQTTYPSWVKTISFALNDQENTLLVENYFSNEYTLNQSVQIEVPSTNYVAFMKGHSHTCLRHGCWSASMEAKLSYVQNNSNYELEKFKYSKLYDKNSYYTGSDINIGLDILSSSCTKIDQN